MQVALACLHRLQACAGRLKASKLARLSGSSTGATLYTCNSKQACNYRLRRASRKPHCLQVAASVDFAHACLGSFASGQVLQARQTAYC